MHVHHTELELFSGRRNGKFGPYLFLDNGKDSKPEFFSLKGFNLEGEDFSTCDEDRLLEWIEDRHGI